MALSNEDRSWLTGMFDQVHSRVNDEIASRQDADAKIVSSIHQIKEAMQAQAFQSQVAVQEALERHKESAHNAIKTMSFLAGAVAVFSSMYWGIKELVKMIVSHKDAGGAP